MYSWQKYGKHLFKKKKDKSLHRYQFLLWLSVQQCNTNKNVASGKHLKLVHCIFAVSVKLFISKVGHISSQRSAQVTLFSTKCPSYFSTLLNREIKICPKLAKSRPFTIPKLW